MADISQELLAGHLFMQCDTPNQNAFRPLPNGFSTRLCRPDELPTWKYMWAQGQYMEFINQYYDKVYAPHEDEFFRRCTFAVDKNDKPIATSGIWLSYGKISTVLGFFVLPEYQGQGIGRGLFSEVLKSAECPVYVHTHPIANKAIKLYSDFGFKLITDTIVGYRENNLQESLPYLQEVLSDKGYPALQTAKANPALLEAALLSEFAEF